MNPMNATREAVFECTYASAARLWTAHVRAWDAGEAVELFAHELRVDGVAESGTISVRGRKHEPPRTSAYPLAQRPGRSSRGARDPRGSGGG
jgi:hypothetical protein